MQRLIPELQLNVLHAEFTRIERHWQGRSLVIDPFSRLYLITDGEGALTVGSRLALAPGMLVLLPAGLRFRHHPSVGMGHYWIHFTAHVSRAIAFFDLVRVPLFLTPDDQEPLAAELAAMVNGFRGNSAADALSNQARLGLLISRFLRDPNCQWNQPLVGAVGRFMPLLKHIDQHLERSISINELAVRAGLHPNHFSNVFRLHFGVPPGQYILRRRIERAQVLLCHTDRVIKRVAADVGYDDHAYFCRVFRRHTGVTPGTYRKDAEHQGIRRVGED